MCASARVGGLAREVGLQKIHKRKFRSQLTLAFSAGYMSHGAVFGYMSHGAVLEGVGPGAHLAPRPGPAKDPSEVHNLLQLLHCSAICNADRLCRIGIDNIRKPLLFSVEICNDFRRLFPTLYAPRIKQITVLRIVLYMLAALGTGPA